MIVLGIETSCDDTGVGIYCDRRGVLANLRATQLEHREFGGVVPELASRVHLKNLPFVLRAALEDAAVRPADLDAVAVTEGPGLMGSLLVGLAFGVSLAESWERPLIGVHHIESHIMANRLMGEMLYPSLVLVVSGGHSQIILLREPGSYELLGTTRDDAAGEAFDKVGKMLGLGFPGGPEIEMRAKGRNDRAFDLPIARLRDGSFDFSFSGLKTAARLRWEEVPDKKGDEILGDFCASLQRAIVDQLLERVGRALRGRDVAALYLAGGVAANQYLVDRARELTDPFSIPLHAPALEFCTDNGAMVACAAAGRLAIAPPAAGSALTPFSRGDLTSWR